jgi:hypothetical protein
MKYSAIALFCLCVAGYATADDSEPSTPQGMEHYLDISNDSKSDITTPGPSSALQVTPSVSGAGKLNVHLSWLTR